MSVLAQKLNKNSMIALGVLIVLVALSRFLPHPPNFTAVGALGLFAGYLSKSRFFGVFAPLAVLLVTDVFIGLHETMIFVYGAYALIVILGRLIKQPSPLNIGGASFLAAGLFFIITNAGVWWVSGMYPLTVDGLIASFIAGIPFFKNTLVSTVFFSLVLFSGLGLLQRREQLLARSSK